MSPGLARDCALAIPRLSRNPAGSGRFLGLHLFLNIRPQSLFKGTKLSQKRAES